MKKIITHPFMLSVICALVSFALDFIIIPELCSGWADFIWMTLMIVLPGLVAILLFRNRNHGTPGYIFIGLPVQYVLLIVFAGPISSMWGASIEHTLGWFSYIGSVFPWPFVVTLVQYFAVLLIRKNPFGVYIGPINDAGSRSKNKDSGNQANEETV